MSFAKAVFTLVLKFGGPGLLVLGILDSSFLFAPWGNDLLLIVMTAKHPSVAAMLYYGYVDRRVRARVPADRPHAALSRREWAGNAPALVQVGIRQFRKAFVELTPGAASAAVCLQVNGR